MIKADEDEMGTREDMSAPYGSTSPPSDMGTHWLLRIVAAIIDSIPWTVVSSILWWALVFNGPGAPLSKAIGGFWWLVWIFLVPIFYGVLWVIYGTILESSASAATLGKRVMGLKVQMLNGGKAPSNKVFIRNVSKIFWIVFIIDFLIGIATTGPDPRQRYFDRKAGTTVVSIRQAFAQAPPPPPPPPP
jgi:uncharacterized RDD family membrane protein YckC